MCVCACVHVCVCEKEGNDSTVRLPVGPWQHVSDESLDMSGGYSNSTDLNILTTD